MISPTLYEEICKVIHEAPACQTIEIQRGSVCTTCQRTAQQVMEKVNQSINEVLSKMMVSKRKAN